ncbi:MAG: hypothetical protein Kow00100_09010 [Geothermobacteraceae bacterium]
MLVAEFGQQVFVGVVLDQKDEIVESPGKRLGQLIHQARDHAFKFPSSHPSNSRYRAEARRRRENLCFAFFDFLLSLRFCGSARNPNSLTQQMRAYRPPSPPEAARIKAVETCADARLASN